MKNKIIRNTIVLVVAAIVVITLFIAAIDYYCIREEYKILTQNFNANMVANNKLQQDLDKANDTIRTQQEEIKNILDALYKQDSYYISDIKLSKELQEYIYDECNKYDNVEYTEAIAVLITENRNFDTNLIHYNTNGTKDTGLFQINDINKGWLEEKLGITDLTNPYQNIQAGIYILNSLDYEGHQKYMSYNMGEGGARRRIRNGQYSTKYSRDVISLINEIESLL